MCFTERETYTQKQFREIFPFRETVLRMKSNKTLFFCQIYSMGGGMVHVAIDWYFSLFLNGFEHFS